MKKVNKLEGLGSFAEDTCFLPESCPWTELPEQQQQQDQDEGGCHF